MDKTISLQKKYFDLIKNKLKTIEGRVNKKKKFKEMKKGDRVTVVLEETKEEFDILILDCRDYKDFREMLEHEKLEQVLPGCQNIDEGVKVYHSFDGFEQDAKDFGVVAFEIQKIEEAK